MQAGPKIEHPGTELSVRRGFCEARLLIPPVLCEKVLLFFFRPETHYAQGAAARPTGCRAHPWKARPSGLRLMAEKRPATLFRERDRLPVASRTAGLPGHGLRTEAKSFVSL